MILHVNKIIRNLPWIQSKLMPTYSSKFHSQILAAIKSQVNYKPSNLLGLPVSGHEDIAELCSIALFSAKSIVNKIKNSPITDVHPVDFDNISNELCKVADWAECVRNVHPDPYMRKAADDAYISISTYVHALNSDYSFYQILKNIRDIQLFTSFETTYLVDSLLKEFEMSGIHLKDQLDDFLNMQQDILKLGDIFIKNCNEKRRLTGINIHQIKTLDHIIKLRYESSKILGFPNYSTLVLQKSMAKTPQVVMNFLSEIMQKIEKRAGRKQQKIQHSHNKLINPAKSNENCHFIPFNVFFSTLEYILETTFGVRLKLTDSRDNVWSNQIIKIHVCDSHLQVIGDIYLDLLPRDNKLFSNCHYTLRGRKSEPVYQHPSVYLFLNVPILEHNNSYGISFEGGLTVMHELGHCFHSILYEGLYQHLSGTRCSTDLAEVPSLLFEKFLHDPKVLKMLFSENSTNLDDVIRPKHQFNDILMTCIDAKVDLSLHLLSDSHTDCVDIVKQTLRDHTSFFNKNPMIHYQYFSHLIHYPSKYYSYLWSECCANAIWHQLFQQNAFNPEAGEVFRGFFLQKGAIVDDEDFFEKMMNKKFSFDDLSDYICYEA